MRRPSARRALLGGGSGSLIGSPSASNSCFSIGVARPAASRSLACETRSFRALSMSWTSTASSSVSFFRLPGSTSFFSFSTWSSDLCFSARSAASLLTASSRSFLAFCFSSRSFFALSTSVFAAAFAASSAAFLRRPALADLLGHSVRRFFRIVHLLFPVDQHLLLIGDGLLAVVQPRLQDGRRLVRQVLEHLVPLSLHAGFVWFADQLLQLVRRDPGLIFLRRSTVGRPARRIPVSDPWPGSRPHFRLRQGRRPATSPPWLAAPRSSAQIGLLR